MRMSKSHPLMSMVNNLLVDLPSPSSISYLWNFGSLLGACLAMQIITGMFLAMHYSSDVNQAFFSISHMVKDVNYGHLIKYVHANGASFFFLFVYIHMASGLYYGGYLKHLVWNIGVMMYMLMMATAFLGYVLPWGQMSFWGATVMTSLITAIPGAGQYMVEWLWGGWSMGAPTLASFFVMHYLLPFVLAAFIVMHVMALHEAGSSNPLGMNPHIDKVPFHPYYTTKDLLGMVLATLALMLLSIYSPNLLGDTENYIHSDSIQTPLHIQPEWYFLFAYAILRSIPNKMGGVMAMFSSLLILLVVPFMHTSKQKSLCFSPLGQLLYWLMMTNFLLLTYMGASPVEDPWMTAGQMSTFLYFFYPLVATPVAGLMENKLT